MRRARRRIFVRPPSALLGRGSEPLRGRRRLTGCHQTGAGAARRHPDAAATRQSDATNGRLLRANEELTALVAELRVANEAMLLASEDAQATREEVETVNEDSSHQRGARNP